MSTLDRYTLEDVISENMAGVFTLRKGARIPIRRAG
jgi:hypothetical protein